MPDVNGITADAVLNYLSTQEYAGFKYSAYEFAGDQIDGNGKTIIFAFYARQSYQITLNSENGVQSMLATEGNGVTRVGQSNA